VQLARSAGDIGGSRMSRSEITVAMVAAMPYPWAKASSIRVVNLVRALASEHHDIRVKVFSYQGTDEFPQSERIDSHRVGGFNADIKRYYNWPNKILANAKLILALWRERHKIDVVHCHTIEGLGIALAFKVLSLSRAPICIDVHGPILLELVHYGLIPNWRFVIASVAALEKCMLRNVSHAFVSNEGLKTLLAERIPDERVSVVFDYVDLDVFSPERIDAIRVAELAQRYKPSNEQLIAYIGMFKDYQGVDYLIRAFAALATKRTELRLLLVGDGPCRAQYEEIIQQHGIASKIIMPGLVPHGEVVNWLAVSDLVISARVDNEITRAGFVSQMPEYLAMGKIAVATSVSGCPYLLRDGGGILVAANSDQALVEGIDQALQLTPEARSAMIAKACENVGQFTWQQGIAEVYRVYRNLLNSQPRKNIA